MAETTLAAANVEIVHDKTRNLARFCELIDEAASQGADILVLPEVGLQGYADFALPLGSKEAAEQKQYYFREAEPIPGPTTDRLTVLARRHGMVIQLGLAESALHGNAIYNSTALIGPAGVIGVYRKLHNTFEFPYFSPGEETPVFATAHGTLASLICYDLCFPELLRSYAVKGAEVALMSTAWPMQGRDRSNDYYGWAMELAGQSNAFFNQFWIVISNHCERGAYSQGVDYFGGSRIVDPRGKVVASLGADEGLVVHRADLRHEVLQSRTQAFFGLNLLQDRRPERYDAVLDQTHRYPSQMVASAASRRPSEVEPARGPRLAKLGGAG